MLIKKIMRFSYSAFDNKGKAKKGIVEAGSLKEATQLLINQGWYIKKINPKGKWVNTQQALGFSGVSLIDKVLLVKHLWTMLKSGISLNEALEVIADQTTSGRFKRLINQIIERVKSGQSLANSLSRFPKVFDPLFVNMIRVGEESGTLEENLEYLSNELDDRLELRRNVQAASFYPAIILSATLGLGLVLAYFVLPKITRLFETLSFELPLSTKILLWIADIFDKYGIYIIVSSVIGVIVLRILITQDFIKPVWHRFLLRLPLVGNIIINYNLVLINRTMGILLKSGLTIDQAIIIVTQTTGNFVYKKKLRSVLPQIQKGKSLADILTGLETSRRRPLFPLIMIKMIGVGEKSGRLEESFSYLASYFEREVDNKTKNLTTTIEPILLIAVGLIVGFVAVSVISPIYQVTGQFRR